MTVLISGALAIQSGLIVRPASTAYRLCGGNGNVGVGGRVGLGTLLGPEETGRFRGHRLRVVALFPPRM